MMFFPSPVFGEGPGVRVSRIVNCRIRFESFSVSKRIITTDNFFADTSLKLIRATFNWAAGDTDLDEIATPSYPIKFPVSLRCHQSPVYSGRFYTAHSNFTWLTATRDINLLIQ
jgi:hypothetical protein